MADESRDPVPEYVHKATARKLAAEARFFEEQAREKSALAAMREIETARIARDEALRLTDNDLHGCFYFDGIVDASSAAACIMWLDGQHRRFPDKDLEIIFTSPGGDVVHGLRLFDHIGLVRRQGHKVTTGTLGMAASMAGILLQTGDKRWMGAEASVLIHQVSGGMFGSYGEMSDRMEWIERIQNRILDIFAYRCAQAGKNGTASHPATRSYLKKNWTRKDWWIDSDDCLRLGIVDEIR